MTQAPWQQQPAGPQQQQYPPMPGPQGPPQQQQYPPAPGPQQGPPVQQPWQQAPQAAPPQQQSYPQQTEEGDDEFFTGGTGGKYMSFRDDRCIGYERGGEIIGVREDQQKNRDTKEPDFWPDGNKKTVKIVTVQTAERISGDPDDTGLRTIWLPQSRDITKAVIEAMKTAGDEMRLKLGGQLWVTRTGSRPTTQKNGQAGFPAFTFTARYVPPKGNDAFFVGNAQGAPQGQPGPAQGTPPWQQGPPPQQGDAYATGPQGPQNGGYPPQQQQQWPPQNGGYPTQQQQPAWAQQPPQGGYQPSAPDPANPFPGQQYPPQQGGYPPPQQQQYPQQG